MYKHIKIIFISYLILYLSLTFANEGDFWFNKGLKASNVREKIKCFTKAIEYNSNDAEAYNNRGNVKRKIKDYTGAIKDLTIAIGINPEDPVYFFNRANAFKDTNTEKNLILAISDYSQAIKLNPNFYQAYNNRGTIKILLNQFEDSILDFTKTISIHPPHANAYNNRGFALFNLKKYKDAIKDFTKTIQMNPQHVNAYVNRANAKDKLGDKAGAKQDFEKAKVLGWIF
ncbi:hypothetical protein BVX93_00315 [bacterium B13(2017)]|nr:hypothetical protein BVX93_00315 [bacterium B13(2017)]